MRSLPPMFSTSISAGTLYHHRMAGGGGWGDALEREPEAVAFDVRNEKVSATQARAQYGVVLRDDGTPDVEETKQLRAHIRAGRKEEVA
jgi:N-methylhydantoinase B